MNSKFLCLCFCFDLLYFFQKHKHGKNLQHKGLPNEKIYREVFTSNTTTSHMAYESGSAVPPQSEGVVREDTDGLLYDDLSIREHAEDEHMSPSSPLPTSGGLPVNRRSRSIEKRRGKQKQMFKSDVVMQMWQKVYEESKRTESMSTATTPDLLDTCQDILEATKFLDEIYTPALQVFIDKSSYEKPFTRMKLERWMHFLHGIIGTTPYVLQPPPLSDF